MRSFARAVAGVCALAASAQAITLDLTSPDSIKSASKTIAGKMLQWYTGNQPGQTPGLLPQPYYWWEAGAMFGALIDYWYYTGDSQYNQIVTQALLWQSSPTYDFMPQNRTKDEGNDDQVFWAFAVMTAAEYKFAEPDPKYPSWVAQAQAVFNTQRPRWDTQYCGGGLRWQIFSWNNGYDYKNAPSNGGLINLSARLFAYTGNQTYSDTVTLVWDWMESVHLISDNDMVYDGTTIGDNCTTLDHHQWTYNAGMLINAAAVMWNVTGDQMWKDRAQNLWTAASNTFFVNKVMQEKCELPGGLCNTDQLSFKAYFARFLAASTKVAPWLYDQVQPYLAASAQAAAAQCNGGSDQITCGTRWTNNGVWDGETGVGQQLTALEVVSANLIQNSYSPVSQNTGGLSKGNASFGNGDSATSVTYAPITTADRAGAGILTAIVLAMTIGLTYFMVIP